MNGQAPPNTKLLLALISSCLLHAGVIFLPYLGAHSRSAHPPPIAHLANQRAIVVRLLAPAPVAATDPSPDIVVDNPPDAPPAAPEETVAEPAKGADLLPFPAPVYYETDQLTKRPQPDFLAELETAETKIIVASGKMILRLLIDDQGAIADVVIEKSDLPEAFSRAATAAFRQSRFVPGERNGLRVGSIMRIEVSYDDGRTPEPQPSVR